MKQYFINLLSAILATSLLGSASAVLARMPQDITNDEMALLPAYCPYTQGFKLSSPVHAPSAAVQRWESAMGKGFWHMHHHCWALINFNRASKSGLPESTRKALLIEARDDFLYVIRTASEDFVLLPEVLTWMGRNAIHLRNLTEAEKAFARARELKPDYWPAYFHWALSLQGRGKKAEALELLRSGLYQAPNNKTMLSLYTDLGGKQSDIPEPKPKEPTPIVDDKPVSE